MTNEWLTFPCHAFDVLAAIAEPVCHILRSHPFLLTQPSTSWKTKFINSQCLMASQEPTAHLSTSRTEVAIVLFPDFAHPLELCARSTQNLVRLWMCSYFPSEIHSMHPKLFSHCCNSSSRDWHICVLQLTPAESNPVSNSHKLDPTHSKNGGLQIRIHWIIQRVNMKINS